MNAFWLPEVGLISQSKRDWVCFRGYHEGGVFGVNMTLCSTVELRSVPWRWHITYLPSGGLWKAQNSVWQRSAAKGMNLNQWCDDLTSDLPKKVHSLKLTYHLKMMVSNRNLLFQELFSGAMLVSGRVHWYNMIKQVVLFDVSCLPGRERSKANSSFKRHVTYFGQGLGFFWQKFVENPSKSL